MAREPEGQDARVDYVFQFGDVWNNFDELLHGALLTLRLAALAMVFGLIVAVACALGRSSRWFGPIVNGYVELIRNTPLLVQVFIVFFGLPAIGVRLEANTAALLAMVINVGAYATEIVRAGIEAVPRGQIEAGMALGLRPLQIFRKIIIFQALKVVFPALGSQFILIMLASSIMSTIAAEELTAAANNIQSRTFRSFEVYAVVTGMYFVMALGFSSIFFAIEHFIFKRQERAVRSRA
jgi:polar amino acid transport system permease protein